MRLVLQMFLQCLQVVAMYVECLQDNYNTSKTKIPILKVINIGNLLAPKFTQLIWNHKADKAITACT